MQEIKAGVVLPRKEAIPRLHECRKKDSPDGTTWEKKARKTEAEMGGLCQPGEGEGRGGGGEGRGGEEEEEEE